MFSLILTIIAIALVVVLSLAAMYYGGIAVSSSSQKALATQLISETQQIQSAVSLFKVDHDRLPLTGSELTADGKYMQAMPKGWEDATAVFKTTGPHGISETTCLDFNKQKNIPFVPNCSDEAYRRLVVCCVDTPTP
jgi:type II secretory pathway pseudopilin PulG